MPVTISPKAAITKGHWMINVPAIAVLVLIVGYGIFLVINGGAHPVLVFMLLILALFVAFVVRFVMITPWKFWAFSQVDDILALKKLAQKAGFIYGKNIFEEREIRSPKNLQKWQAIKTKMEKQMAAKQ